MRLPLLLVAVVLAMLSVAARAADGPVYELRVYTCEPGKLDALNTRFREHTLGLFEKHGMKNVAYWTPSEGPLAETTLIYILEHQSRDAAAASWEAFRADPEWKAVAAQSTKDHGKILANPPEATYMTATDYSRVIGPVDPGKSYELRTYVAADGKFDALNARFRDHTDKLFTRHGMKSLGYWIPLDEPKSKNTLIYVIQHDSRDQAAESWKAFGADPEWQAAKAASETGGPLLAERPSVVFLKATNYSPRPQP